MPDILSFSAMRDDKVAPSKINIAGLILYPACHEWLLKWMELIPRSRWQDYRHCYRLTVSLRMYSYPNMCGYLPPPL